MITHEMLDIYCRFSGDIDGYARLGRPEQRKIIDEVQWREVTNLLQELFLLANAKTTPEYSVRSRVLLKTLAADSSVEERLLALAQIVPRYHNQWPPPA